VIKLPNNIIARAPYVLPYVRPSIRLSLPVENELAFSRRVWQLNLDFYLSTMLRVKDSHHAFKQLAYYIGFNDESLLAGMNPRTTCLCPIYIDDVEGKRALEEQGLTPETILAKNQQATLRYHANVSWGAECENVLDKYILPI
jgi:hypothetical protein